MCIPTMMAYAAPEHLTRYVKPALHGDEVWCQLFSEPAAGSDVAGIRTRAERDGDGWVINGQKVWTSGAHYCDYGIIITRTDPNVPKHSGLTMFFLSMKTPGVEVRPIKQISGGANFNEVFFTDVRIPDSQRLGKVGEGWKAALTTLMNERLAVGLPSGGLDIDELMELARDTDLDDGPAIRNQQVRGKIAEWYVQQQGLKLTRYRTLTALSKGQTPGPESSIIKIVAAPKMQDMGAFAMELMGHAGIMKEDVPHAAGFQAQWIGGSGFTIAGGTDEILRNIVAERVLGLPADIRVDKDIPFNKLGKGEGRAMNRLDGKVAFLSGAARGIGGATAKLMASAGAKGAIGDGLDARGRQTATKTEAGRGWTSGADGRQGRARRRAARRSTYRSTSRTRRAGPRPSTPRSRSSAS